MYHHLRLNGNNDVNLRIIYCSIIYLCIDYINYVLIAFIDLYTALARTCSNSKIIKKCRLFLYHLRYFKIQICPPPQKKRQTINKYKTFPIIVHGNPVELKFQVINIDYDVCM